ncbi:phage tail domain-containing protein [Peribacillus simplex]|uniref:phage tail domain-containing protein n=1 Tax=Peribacillus simplex TaxID=1478 RepID=UPI00339A3525
MGKYDLLLDFGDGEKKLSELLPKVILLSFSPPAPIIERNMQSIPGRNGLVITNQNKTLYKERQIPVKLFIKSVIPEQFYLWRHEIYKLLVRDQPYYISTTFEPYKRWLVTCDGDFAIEKDGQYMHKEFELNFTSLNGLAESKYTTTSSELNLSKERFGIGMNIPSEDHKYKYSGLWDPSQFSIYNAGDITVFPTEHDYTVEFTFVGKDVKIKNNTNGEYLIIKGSFNKEKVNIIRQYVMVDGKVPATQGRFPSLVPGVNRFEITGSRSTSVAFDFRFYYK